MRSTRLAALGFLLASTALPCAAECYGGPDEPRTLVLALDGVALRAVEAARERGAYEDWPTPIPVVSTFPSLTNIAFTAMFQPFGVEPARGYEVRHFDVELNEVIGGSPIGYSEHVFAWRDVFDVTGRSLGGKLGNYTKPRKKAFKAVDAAEEFLLDSDQELVLVHVGASDALAHLRGDKAIIEFMIKLEGRVEEIRQRHEARFRRPLRIVLVSDHGNSAIKIQQAKKIRRELKRAGLHLVDRLEEPDDIVAATFGLVGYGALFVDPTRAEKAARAVINHERVNLAFWQIDEQRFAVVANDGEAVIHTRMRDQGRELAYEATMGDPFGILGARQVLADGGHLDAEGFASEQAWFEVTALADLPDPLSRVVDGLSAPYIVNHGTVLFSLEPGYVWGWRSANASSKLQGGKLEGTHGAIDRESTLGFFLSNDPDLHRRDSVPVHLALADLAELRRCVMARKATEDTSGASSANGATGH